jgi:hypothetical protein
VCPGTSVSKTSVFETAAWGTPKGSLASDSVGMGTATRHFPVGSRDEPPLLPAPALDEVSLIKVAWTSPSSAL